MPSYEEIIEQSQANVNSLNQKLIDLDKLYQDIVSLKEKSEEIPLAFEQTFQKIAGLSKEYTEALGTASKSYLDGSNSLFTSKLNDLANKNQKLEKEISRLVDTDLTKLFNDMQIVFIEQTKKDLDVELTKINEKTDDFQTKINSLSGEINRLKKVDLEKHFDKHQKTLSDIFGAINTINTTLSGLTSSLNSVIQSLGQIQKVIVDNSEETIKLLKSLSKETHDLLNEQNKNNKSEFGILKKEIANLSKQNSSLKKDIKTNRIIQIIGLIITLAGLTYLMIK